MGRRVMAALAAMVIGLIGVAAVLLYAKGADARAVGDQQPQSVFIAQELIPTGTTAADAVAKGLMVQTKIAAKGVPAGALTQVDPATGKLVALTDIAAGDFVVGSRFGKIPAAAEAIKVPDGQVAISFTLSDPGRVGSFMRPGSHIVLYDTYTPPAGAAASPATEGRRPGASQRRPGDRDRVNISDPPSQGGGRGGTGRHWRFARDSRPASGHHGQACPRHPDRHLVCRSEQRARQGGSQPDRFRRDTLRH
jgi:hypothetical protein